MVSAARFHCETLSAIMRVNRRLAQLRIAGDLALHALPSASPSSAQRVVCTDLEIGLVIASQRFGISRQQAYLGHKTIRHTSKARGCSITTHCTSAVPTPSVLPSSICPCRPVEAQDALYSKPCSRMILE